MHRLGDYYTKVLQHELNEFKESEELYYHFEFPDETRREVNPFKLRNFLSDKCRQNVKKFTTDSKKDYPSKSKIIMIQTNYQK